MRDIRYWSDETVGDGFGTEAPRWIVADGVLYESYVNRPGDIRHRQVAVLKVPESKQLAKEAG